VQINLRQDKLSTLETNPLANRLTTPKRNGIHCRLDGNNDSLSRA